LRNYCRNAKLHFQITFSLPSTSSLLKLPDTSHFGNQSYHFRRLLRAKTMKSDSNSVWYMYRTDGSKPDFREYFQRCYKDREREHRGLVEILSVTFECKRKRTKTTQHPCPEGPLLIQEPPPLPLMNPLKETRSKDDCGCQVNTIPASQID